MSYSSKTKKAYKVFILVLVNILVFSLVYSDVNAYSQIGAQGTEVREIQTKLTELGYLDDSIDGIYGENTRAAITAFQKDYGLTVDGIAGDETLSALGITSTVSSSGGYGGFTQAEYELFARVVSAEARGESYEGQVAVAAVILNRIAHPSFPNTLSGVIYQPLAFSCLYDGGIDAEVADSAYQAVRDAINGSDPSGGAIYYYNPVKSTSQWIFSRQTIAVIGDHVFAI